MNLPAVLLFICFSTAYGLQCKDGLEATISDATVNVVKTISCFSKYCARFEFRSSLGHASIYACGGRQTINCRTPEQHRALQQLCGQSFDLCTENAGCEDAKETINGEKVDMRLCCSKDSSFSGMTSLNGTNWILIISITAGAIVLLILLIVAGVLIYVCCYKKKKAKAPVYQQPYMQTPGSQQYSVQGQQPYWQAQQPYGQAQQPYGQQSYSQQSYSQPQQPYGQAQQPYAQDPAAQEPVMSVPVGQPAAVPSGYCT